MQLLPVQTCQGLAEICSSHHGVGGCVVCGGGGVGGGGGGGGEGGACNLSQKKHQYFVGEVLVTVRLQGR